MAPSTNADQHGYSVCAPRFLATPWYNLLMIFSRPCMELFSGNGEPDIRERPFEELPGLEGFNAFYKRNGGVGGGMDDRLIRPPGEVIVGVKDDIPWKGLAEPEKKGSV